jgi:hypothetical protein
MVAAMSDVTAPEPITAMTPIHPVRKMTVPMRFTT